MQVRKYFRDLSNEVGNAWNRFWFDPSDGFDLCVFRVLMGGLTLIWQLSFTPDLIRWFGSQGWFDGGVLQQWLIEESTIGFSGRLSFLYTPNTTFLWTAHVLSSLVLIAFVLGFYTRISAILSFVVLLSYVHRAPFVCGATEVVLTLSIGYLCLAPCGQALSWDARRRKSMDVVPSSWSTLARHLLQIHLVLIYAIMVLSKLGASTWWNGEAVWWLTAQPLAPLVNFNGLRDMPLLLNLWTYFILLAEFSFIVLVWNRRLRPLVLATVTVSWISIGAATGNMALPITMIVANLVFVTSPFWRELLATPQGQPTRADADS